MTLRNRPAERAGLLLDEGRRPGSLRERQSRIIEPHVAALNQLARSVAAEIGSAVPWADPASGGNQARVLLLLEEHIPCRSAGSGLVSLHVNDPTAANIMSGCQQAGLQETDVLLWQVIPWWTHDPALSVPVRSRAEQARLAGPWLGRLLELLGQLRVVVLMGRQTQMVWDRASRFTSVVLPDTVRILPCPHPSPMAWHVRDRASGRPHRELAIEVLADAARYARADS